MDRRLSPTRHYLPSRSSRDSIPVETVQLRVTPDPTTKRTLPCCSGRLSYQKTDPHPSRVEYYSTTLSTPRVSLLRGSSAALPRATHLGPRNRLKTGSPQRTSRKDLLSHSPRTRRIEEIRHRAYQKRLHSPLQKPLRRSLLFHQEEGWETQTRPRLPTPEPMDSSKHIPAPANSPTHKQSPRQSSVH